MRLFFRLFKESVLFALTALIVNKLRTFLSLLGVTIGIFAIIAVFTMVDSMEMKIQGSISALGDDVVFIEKWPWTFGPGYEWWEYLKRPVATLEELKEIQNNCESARASTLKIDFDATIECGNSSMENINVIAATHGFSGVRDFELSMGRYFSESESKSGSNIAVIGADVAMNLFGSRNPLNKDIKMKGKKLKVVAVFKKEGESMFDVGFDNKVLIPLNFARRFISIKRKHRRSFEPEILIRAKAGVSNQELMDELTGLIRSLRKLKPREENNFALNEAKMFANMADNLIGFVRKAGIFIWFFALLVGGFGIANIMFVSVKERTHLIGIQKSLGAKNYFILFQFLIESVLLSILGGIIGLGAIFIGTIVMNYLLDMEIYLTVKNITKGIVISASIGFISGIIPAWVAARLNPVEAIRAN
ncbi:MAG: ABC transporter [Flavobacteriales bacterium]|nr:ABC transporter permease [Bacteroidales bacterium AH-315-I05]PCJ83002.1 MAG: ABC transporter [Flavobacteriales bacterium]